jgi:GT2 family glycosyltransferase
MTAIVLHYRYWPDVRLCLDALLEQHPAEAVCIVDQSEDVVVFDELRVAYPKCHVIGRSNRGFAAGMNQGIATCTGDTLLLAHDCVLEQGAVASMQARLSAAPHVGLVGPMLGYRSDPDAIYSQGGLFEGRRMVTRHRLAGEQLAGHRSDAPITSMWLSGACLVVRRAVLDSVGPLDETYFMYFEDVDYALRVRRQGWSVECVPEAVGWQEPGKPEREMWVRNRLRVLWRYNRSAWRLQLARDIGATGGLTVRGRSKAAREVLRGVLRSRAPKALA